MYLQALARTMMRRGRSGREAWKALCLRPCGLSALMLSPQGYASTYLISYHGALAAFLSSNVCNCTSHTSFQSCMSHEMIDWGFAMQGITQVIDAEGGTVQNIADFRIAKSINGYLNVEGTVAPVEGSGEAVRVDVKFTAFCLKIGALPQLKVPLGWSNPTVSPLSPLALVDSLVGNGDIEDLPWQRPVHGIPCAVGIGL